jgi:uncharacterized protein (TIGR04255 family)
MGRRRGVAAVEPTHRTVGQTPTPRHRETKWTDGAGSTMVLLVHPDLPAPKEEPLRRSPLRLVAFQVRHTGSARLGDVSVGLAIHEAMGGSQDWRLEPVQTQMRITASMPSSAGSVPVEYQTGGWRLLSLDGRSTIAIMPDNVAFETTHYSGWEDFSSTLARLINAVCELVQPEAELRLGLRYINRIEQPEVSEPGDWSQWIDENLLGIVRHPIGHGLTAAQQQVQFDAGDEMRAVMQHGFFHDQALGRLAYYMDFDTYRDGVRLFQREDVRNGTITLHALALQLFQSMITSRMYEYLRG